MNREQLQERISLIEEAYEFFLAYAAQGLESDVGAKSGSELRSYLERTEVALDELADGFCALVREERLEPEERFLEFFAVAERDARSSRAAVRLVLAQASIGSQLIDNLNASMHLRALLTDLFLIDEVLARIVHEGP